MSRLIDRFGRRATTLRLSVTDRCDLRCVYCMPEEGTPHVARRELLSFDEIVRLVRILVRLGIRELRVTGGEPLLRHDLPVLIARLSAVAGLDDLALTTNATRLEAQAERLRAAGLKRLNVSLDTLDPGRFAALTRGGELARVLRGIDAAIAAGLQPIKLNMVVLRGVNDGEVGELLEFALARGLTMRYLEAMPLGEAGAVPLSQFVPTAETLARLAGRFRLEALPYEPGSTAVEYRVAGSSTRVGFLSPVSERFCASCNRLRLSAQGYLQLCLAFADGIDLRTPLRSGRDGAELAALIEAAVYAKPEGNHFDAAGEPVYQINMSRVGG